MADVAHQTRSPLLRAARRGLPALISAGLVGWLVWRVSPGSLARAAAALDWPALVPWTLAELFALFGWDIVCLRWLFSQPDRPLPFRAVLRARARSYLWMVLNYGLGQGVLAWHLARARGLSLASAIGRCVLMALHDLTVLFSLGLGAALLNPDPRARPLRWVCAVGLLVLAGVALALILFPARWRTRLAPRADWLGWWSWRHSLTLLGLRGAFFLIIAVYVTVGLRLAGFPLEPGAVYRVIPLVLLAEALPSISGLGTRDTALLGLLHPAPELRGLVLAFSLLWSSVLLIGRVAVGLAAWWLPPAGPAPTRPAAGEGHGNCTSGSGDHFGSGREESDGHEYGNPPARRPGDGPGAAPVQPAPDPGRHPV